MSMLKPICFIIYKYINKNLLSMGDSLSNSDGIRANIFPPPVLLTNNSGLKGDLKKCGW